MMQRVRTFLVEDSAVVRDRILELLAQDDSVEVVGYADCENDAIRQIRALCPAAVVTDMQLRQGNGIGVIAAIRADSLMRQPKVIVFTGFPWHEYRRTAERLTTDYFLDKNLEFDQLRDVLRAIPG